MMVAVIKDLRKESNFFNSWYRGAFLTRAFFEVATESWPEWDLNPRDH